MNKKRIFPRGKKAMMDDLFDLLFTVIAAMFVYFFVSMIIQGSINAAHRQTEIDLEGSNAQRSLIAFLQNPLYYGDPEIDDYNYDATTMLAFMRNGIDTDEEKEFFKKKAENFFGEFYLHSRSYPRTEEQRKQAEKAGFKEKGPWRVRVLEDDSVVVEKGEIACTTKTQRGVYFVDKEGGGQYRVEFCLSGSYSTYRHKQNE